MTTFLKYVNKNDIYYLTSVANVERRQFGWNTMDDSTNITWKYIHFIYNMNDEFLNYDWYIFIDDDTFAFLDKLDNYLSTFNSNECYYIGHELDHIKKEFCLYMSGGAGYAISNALYKNIYNYVQTTGINGSFKHCCDDLCIGLWIQEIAKTNEVKQIHNENFHIKMLKNTDHAFTFHELRELSDFEYYMELKLIESLKKEDNSTTFALITDKKYFDKAKITIRDLRLKGNWQGPIVLATIDFDLNKNFIDYYGITEVKFDIIDKSEILIKIGLNGFTDGDKREINKINQWEKLHIFDEYFKRWERVVYLDAGLRIFDDVKYLLELDYKGKLLAPIDGTLFKAQISYDNGERVANLISEYGDEILEKHHMLNCLWIYDTNILDVCNKSHLIEIMDKYPLCKSNEMTTMNLLFHFKHNLWQPFPEKARNGKFLFEWSELNRKGTDWREYCLIKYPVSISMEDC